jgi:indole-3-glycerol phosphate synthase
MGGASAIAITTDKNSGGCSIQDVVSTVREQATALNDFPSPLPVIVRDLMVDEFQIALAKVRTNVPSSLAQTQTGLYKHVPAYAMCH